MPTDPIMTDSADGEPEQDVEGRYPDADEDDQNPEVPDSHGDEASPAAPPPQPTSG